MTTYQYETDILTGKVISPDECAAIEESFPGHTGAAVGQSRHGKDILNISLAIDAVDAYHAEAWGGKLISEVLASAGLVTQETVSRHLLRWDLFERETDEPNYPDIVNAGETAAILGVSRQRVHQLLRENPGFPEPLYHLRGTGPLWSRPGIEKFAREWDRKPGRRPRSDA